MAKKIHVKTNDRVYVLTGKDAGKSGKVIAVYPATGRILVEGVNLGTRHVKPRTRTQQGGLINQELPIDASNVMLVCSECKRPSKTGVKFLDNGDKVRFCKSCGEQISVIRSAKK